MMKKPRKGSLSEREDHVWWAEGKYDKKETKLTKR
jgi:hypothetical protein